MTEFLDLARLACIYRILCIYVLSRFEQNAVLVVLIDKYLPDHIAESADVINNLKRHLRNDLRV